MSSVSTEDVAVHRYGHARSAARRIAERVNSMNMSAGTKDLILNIVTWLNKMSHVTVNDTISEFLNRQLCTLMDMLDVLLPKRVLNNQSKASSAPITGSSLSETERKDSYLRYSRSILLQAGAEGELPEGVETTAAEAVNEPEVEAEPTRQRVQLQEDDRPDVLLDIPDLTVDNMELEVHDLHVDLKIDTRVAHSLKKKARRGKINLPVPLVKFCPNVEVNMGSASVKINSLRANALCVVRLNNMRRIVADALHTVERNPEVIAAMISFRILT